MKISQKDWILLQQCANNSMLWAVDLQNGELCFKLAMEVQVNKLSNKTHGALQDTQQSAKRMVWFQL